MTRVMRSLFITLVFKSYFLRTPGIRSKMGSTKFFHSNITEGKIKKTENKQHDGILGLMTRKRVIYLPVGWSGRGGTFVDALLFIKSVVIWFKLIGKFITKLMNDEGSKALSYFCCWYCCLRALILFTRIVNRK